MKRRPPFYYLICGLLLLAPPAIADELVLYNPPPGIDAANDFELEVNGKKVFVYNSRAAAFASFSFSGTVTIKVIIAGPVYNYDIRPLSRQIKSSLYRSEISFTLDKPDNLSIEINKNIKRPLFIFANPLETVIPDKKSPNTIYYEAGKVHTPGKVMVKSNQVVYIEGGAVVRGSFLTDKGKDIKFIGRGIIDNHFYERGEARPIEINQCNGVLVEGIILMESKSWSCGSFASQNVTYRNMKVVSANDWDDGIDIVGSQNILVENCFIFSKDDCVAIKAGIDYFNGANSQLNVYNVTVQNSTFWNGVWGNALEIGFETRADTIQQIVFKNCDIIHVEGPEGTFTIHNGDRAVIKNVLYEDIRVEDSRGYLIDFKILDSRYTKDKQKGYIRDIYFKNIQVEGDIFPTSVIMGFNEKHTINNITLDNVRIHGRKVTSTYNGMLTTIHADNIIYK